MTGLGTFHRAMADGWDPSRTDASPRDASQPRAEPGRRRRVRIVPIVLAVIGLAILALILLWNWDWFIPFVDARASAAIGRQVTIRHLHVRLGWNTRITADDVVVANPAGFPPTAPLARIAALTVVANVRDYIDGKGIVLPLIALDHPALNARALPDGKNNFTLALAKGGNSSAKPPQIGDLRITDGTGQVYYPKLKADFGLGIATREAGAGKPASLLVDARGRYAGQPILASFVGGALLTLRHRHEAYPIDLRIENGTTKAQLVGTVRDPLHFAGADLQLRLSGDSMAKLYALSGIPLPATPPFTISGALDYAPPKFRFHDFVGRVGSSDLEGDIDEAPGLESKPDVTMDLRSSRVDLTDLGGLVGTPPGKLSTPGQTAQQKAALEQAEHKKTLLPDTPIDIPRLRSADLHVRYVADHIENKFVPIDKIRVVLDEVGGRITVHPADFAVGTGAIQSHLDLTPQNDRSVRASADFRFQRLDLGRIMKATHTFTGQGTIGGEARIAATGTSMASLMGHGNGELKLVMLGGGNLSALLVDLSGLEFGNALMSALGLPQKTEIQCFVADMPLRDGILDTNVLLLDTKEARLTGKGSVDFRNQTLNYSLTTRANHFSVGSLPGPIDITGPLGSPNIRPGTEVVARAGAAAVLGAVLTPIAALLPTIQFGVGDNNACTKAVTEAREPAHERRSHHRRR